MKIRHFKRLLTTILLIGLGFTVLGLTSCDNFLKSNDVRDEIIDAIAYNNANSSTLYFKAETEMGEFFPNREKIFKVGYDAEVQFTVNLDRYVFKGLEAVCLNDTAESRADYVTIEIVSANDKKGIYIYKIKLLREAKDILIRPVCVELPAVKSHTPDSKEPQYANTPIAIKFNMPMEAATVATADSIFNYKNISLIYTDSAKNNTDMSVYFEAPVFNAAKDTLTLTPKAASLKTFIDNRSDVFIDINVSFEDALFVEIDGVKYPLMQNENTSFKVRYNANVETEKPIKSEFFATKEEITLENTECQKLNSIAVEDMTAEQVLQYRIKDCVYLYGKYYDKDSGVAKVIVTVEGEEPVEFTSDSESADFVTDENGYTQFCIKCNLDLGNGVYSVNVAVADACANVSSEEEFTVISRKTYAESELNFTVTNHINKFNEFLENGFNAGKTAYINYIEEKIESDGWDSLVNEINSDVKNLRLCPTELKVLNNANITGDVVPVSDLTLYCEYTDKNGEACKQKFTPCDDFEQTGCLITTLNVDSVCGMTVKILAEDTYGATGELLVDMPEKAYIRQRSLDDDDVTLAPAQPFIGGHNPGLLVGIDADDELYINELVYGYDFGHVPTDSKKVGFFFWTPTVEGLYSDFIILDISDQKVQFAKEPVVTVDENKCINVTFELASDTWEKFDKVEFVSRYEDYWNSGYGTNFEQGSVETVILTKENTTDNKFTYKHDGNYFYHNYYREERFWYDNQSEFWFTGRTKTFQPVHGGALTLKCSLQLDEKEYEDRPPVVVIETRRCDYITFILKDFGNNGSGIDPSKPMYINIKNSNYDYDFVADDEGEYITEIQAQQMYDCMIQEEDGTRKFHFTYTASDKAGNTVTKYPCDIELADDIFDYSPAFVGENVNYGRYISINDVDQPDYADVYYIKKGEDYWSDPVEIREQKNQDDYYCIYPTNYATVLADGNFVKICQISKENDNWLMPLYAYCGTVANEDDSYNLMIPGVNNSVAIGSKAPVLVASYTTGQPYEVCKTWSPYEWRLFGEESWVTYLDFSSNNTTLRSYTGWSPREGQCVVIIAFYANGKTVAMSEIYQGE